MALATTRFGCNRIFAHDSFFQHPLASDTSRLWDPEELCESDTLLFQVWQTYCEIAGADGSNVFQRADFSTDIYIPDDLLHVLKDGIGGVPDTADAAGGFSAGVFEILTDCVTVSGTAVPDARPSSQQTLRNHTGANSELCLTITRFTYGNPGALAPINVLLCMGQVDGSQ